MKIVMETGLPASGKSTHAKSLVEKGYKRVNRDDLRAMIDNGKFSDSNEKIIKEIETTIVNIFLNHGKNVVIDDTHLSNKSQMVWVELAATREVQLEISDFTHVSVEECIKRDQKRPNYVGEKVIRRMYRQNLQKRTHIIQDPKLPHAVICDLDGTLALFDDMRSPYSTELCESDKINQSVRYVLNLIKEPRIIIFVSGRYEKFRPQTERWLKSNEIEYTHLYMRPDDEHKNDYLVKEDIFNLNIKNRYYIDFVMDDRDRVVDLWRSLGLNCFQVNYGDF